MDMTDGFVPQLLYITHGSFKRDFPVDRANREVADSHTTGF